MRPNPVAYQIPFCINEKCENFTPEDKRGGWKKKEAAGSAEDGEKSK